MKTLIILLTGLFSYLNAAATFTQGSTAAQLAAQIQGNGITITNPRIIHGADSQRGIFSNGITGAGLEIDEGITLTCMTVAESFTTNNRGATSRRPSGKYYDNDLMDIDSRAIYNPVIFEFDVTLDDNTRLLILNYQFASEEYNEYVGSRFNDSFGFFISGGDLNATYNIARVVDSQTYVNVDNINNYKTVTINNVNNGSVGIHNDATPEDLTNSALFIDNTVNPKPLTVEYDGITKTLNATLDNLTPGVTYNFKIAIADTGDSALDTGVFIKKIQGLREPQICYDYAYKQNGRYLTEGYDPHTGPFVSGNVIANDSNFPIEVAMYIKNERESEITASNVKLNIYDINTSQATYKSESVWVIQPGDVYRTKIDDVDINSTIAYVNEIPIDSFNSLQYFYTYFSIDALTSPLSLPIKARIDYNLSIPLSQTETLVVPRSSYIDSDIAICGGGNNNFDPVYTIFNVIENGLYTDNTNYSYNINTQIAGREASLSIATIDANSTDLHTILDGVYTVVAVDMLDLTSFHDTSASCNEVGNAISQRVWTPINGTGVTPLETSNTDLYTIARENVALRISHTVVNDENELLQLEPVTSGGITRWNILNFSDAVQNGTCNTNTANDVDDLCSDSGTPFSSAMTTAGLTACMECVYGINTKLTCARDNFSIRPEAFLINLDDQNQTDTTQAHQRITNGLSGVQTPPKTRINLAAGYAYNLEINATNHEGNEAVAGYNYQLNVKPDTSAQLVWAPRSGQTVSGCNDTANKDVTANFNDGRVDTNITLTQVGDYNLELLDQEWTSIDSTEQSHHARDYFLSGPDCVLNSTNTALVGENDSLNGCDISSTHIGSEDSNLTYVDLNISSDAFRFDVSAITPSVGINHQPLTATSFVYMTNMSRNSNEDQNMSFHLNGNVQAVGFNDAELSNYVNNCYAKPIDINISISNSTLFDIDGNQVIFQTKFHNNDENNSRIIAHTLDSNETNGSTSILIQPQQAYFTRELRGSMNTVLNINYDRNTSVPVNPIAITYGNYDVNCSVAADCIVNADMSNKSIGGSFNITNGTIRHYYGRTNAPRQRFQAPSGNAFIYYEVYCNGVGCDKTLLQDGNGSKFIDDARWLRNDSHSVLTHGNQGIISQKGPNFVQFSGAHSVPGKTTTLLRYQDNSPTPVVAPRGYPYKATMQNSASRWLIYNRFNENSIRNEFEIEFNNPNSAWVGKDGTDTNTKKTGALKTNRRSMW